MMAIVILFLIFLAVMYLLRYLARRPDLMAHGLMWILTRKQRREQRERERQSRSSSEGDARRSSRTHGGKEPIIPREYARDAEYVEVKDAGRVAEAVPTSVENQVSDAEWEEI